MEACDFLQCIFRIHKLSLGFGSSIMSFSHALLLVNLLHIFNRYIRSCYAAAVQLCNRVVLLSCFRKQQIPKQILGYTCIDTQEESISIFLRANL